MIAWLIDTQAVGFLLGTLVGFCLGAGYMAMVAEGWGRKD